MACGSGKIRNLESIKSNAEYDSRLEVLDINNKGATTSVVLEPSTTEVVPPRDCIVE